MTDFQWLLLLVFSCGYLFITLETVTHVNKTAIALLTAAVCWLAIFLVNQQMHADQAAKLEESLASISQIIFFLLGALIIVEAINAHHGFQTLLHRVQIRNPTLLLWGVTLTTFFLSAILDNLTTTIVMVSLLDKLIKSGNSRRIMGGAIVIAANAGGAWTPIGDVTTTMLWIGEQITSLEIMRSLFLPSFTCSVVGTLLLAPSLKNLELAQDSDSSSRSQPEPYAGLALIVGLAGLVSVPLIKMTTGLPPFMGMLLALSIMWIVTDILHCNRESHRPPRLPYVLSKIDLASVLFFLGILLAVAALEHQGILLNVAQSLDDWIGNSDWIAVSLGIVSAIIDNVPLVAAAQAMYTYPVDDRFWQLVAYCAGTGGSILIIGSAAGVVYMALEHVSFFWYMRRISLPALAGYAAGIAVYMLQKAL